MWTENARRRRRRWSRHASDFWDEVTVVTLVCVLCCTVAQQANTRVVTVIVVSQIGPAGNRECEIECTGLLLRKNVVLTTAACVATNKTDTDVVEVKEAQVYIFCRRSFAPSHLPIYVEKRFLHYDWNPITHKNDFAVLKTEQALVNQFEFTLNNPNLQNVPDQLFFRGYGMLSSNGRVYAIDRNTMTKENDRDFVRNLNVTHSPCKVVIENEVQDDPNWFEFLCTSENKSESNLNNVRITVENTLCPSDVGGPLYSNTRNNYEVWALLSQIAHLKYPFCAKKCYVFPNAPYPCNQNPKNLEDGMNYRFVLINKWWVERTIERMDQKKMPTTTCFPSTKKTTDPYYDSDIYQNYREMTSNFKVCKSNSDRNKPEAYQSSYFWVIVVVHIIPKEGWACRLNT